ncbi:hypothetical protein PPL_03327 [Heterostelium album PN500]|uniref:Uncharacterized protein n=1 Tax=Heterostelium pallidum (strain ATCC 26659 / Pp 5 / PN500) TaxID=670386 RepID=D3B4K2_HETP5|nr:hypothetical protein PPL_03327 [Heterostelium album PN500]EFA84250.1 hypothetical protein PPL_03327 [Heterostelium album PN500]|eukprot:XP_020436366.1 hypothetical protein PPL_03327 [Heterostelium album PN500]
MWLLQYMMMTDNNNKPFQLPMILVTKILYYCSTVYSLGTDASSSQALSELAGSPAAELLAGSRASHRALRGTGRQQPLLLESLIEQSQQHLRGSWRAATRRHHHQRPTH